MSNHIDLDPPTTSTQDRRVLIDIEHAQRWDPSLLGRGDRPARPLRSRLALLVPGLRR